MKRINNNNEKESKFWSFLGKISSLVILFFTIVQIYNSIIKSDYSANIIGNHSIVSYPPSVLDDKEQLNKYIFFLRHYPIAKKEIVSNIQLDSIIKHFARVNIDQFDYEFESKINKNVLTTIWTFELKNDGNKPLEDLIIILPFDGQYKIIDPDNITLSGSFTDRIKLGSLNPLLSIKITLWTRSYGSEEMDIYDEKKCYVTHKYGTFDISFPYQSRGFLASILKQDFLGSFVYIIIFFLLGCSIYLIIYRVYLSDKSSSSSNNNIEEDIDENYDSDDSENIDNDEPLN
ncbi:MAG: hypothetical protein AB7O73_03940 [Bacteroidia bacterium]